jgi:hypothetical protein
MEGFPSRWILAALVFRVFATMTGGNLSVKNPRPQAN